MLRDTNDLDRVVGRARLAIQDHCIDDADGRDVTYEVGFNYAGSKSVVVAGGTVLWDDMLKAGSVEAMIRRRMTSTVWDMLEGLDKDFLFAVASPGDAMNVRVESRFLRDMKVLMEQWYRLTVVMVVPFDSEVPLLSACSIALPAWLSLEIPPNDVRVMLSQDLIQKVVESSPSNINVDWRDTLARKVRL